MATSLEFNDRTGETCFAIVICLLGLILFALLIGNLQVYLQSSMPYKRVKRREQKMKKRRALKEWSTFRSLPKGLQDKVRKCKHHTWLEATEVHIKSLLNDLPEDLQSELKEHFRKNLFKKVEKFGELHEKRKSRLLIRAKPVVYQAGDVIQKKGEKIQEMIHIVGGTVLVSNGNDKEEECEELKEGDSFGKDLFLWAEREAKSRSSKSAEKSNLPLAKQTVKSDGQVDAFTLSSDMLIHALK